MRIAQIAPLHESVPPKKYGGTERVVYNLTEELVKRGHDVTLFASANSTTSAKLVSVFHDGLRQEFPSDERKRFLYTLLHLQTAYSQEKKFDLIHDHNGFYGAPFAQHSRKPVVMTLHGQLPPETKTIFKRFNKPKLVAISHNQQERVPQVKFTSTVYNGLDFNHYPFGRKYGNYLVFVGRICAEKGVHHAIDVAEAAGIPLIIAAKYEPAIKANKEYYLKFIKPRLNHQIRWIGEVSQEKRNELFANALASLHPATWAEPFGLTLIEAMACGCPVVAFKRGAIPEVVQHGLTGYVVTTVNDMIESLKKIAQISRSDCAEFTRENFSAVQMADGYERVYQNALTS
jgi:glycosyltransferase involved in cell wall biosynthesis